MTKQEQRACVLAARRALTGAERAAYSAAICASLAALPLLKEAKTFLSYRALWDEVDPAALEALLPGAVFAYPRCAPGRTLEARVPTGPLLAGPYGIAEPDPAASRLLSPEALDAVLVPCLGFDAAGNRLGHGGGYYDRYLPRCQNALTVCLAFEAQRLERAVTAEHDRPVDLVATERTLHGAVSKVRKRT